MLGRARHVMLPFLLLLALLLLAMLLLALLLLHLLLAGCHVELLVQFTKDSGALQHALLYLL